MIINVFSKYLCSKLVTTGSILHINADYDDQECYTLESKPFKGNDYIGEPVKSFDIFEKELQPVDTLGLVQKKILEEGGGLALSKDCTVSVAYAGYWENEFEPYDFTKLDKPLVCLRNYCIL